MSGLHFLDVIYGAKGNPLLTGATPPEKKRNLRVNDCKTPADIAHQIGNLRSALSKLDDKELWKACCVLGEYHHFMFEDPRQPGKVVYSSLHIADGVSELADDAIWPTFVEAMKTSIVRQRLVELKEKARTHLAFVYYGLKAKKQLTEHNHKEHEAMKNAIDALTLENILDA